MILYYIIMFRRNQQVLNYDVLLELESAQADLQEMIDLPALGEDSPELALATSPALRDGLAAGSVRRRDLLDGGFSFINIIGGAEKPIIAARIPASGNDGSVIDTTRRVLLTEDELAAVKRFQRLRPELYGGDGTEDARADMLRFLLDAVRGVNPGHEAELFKAAQAYILHNGTEADKEVFIPWFAQQVSLDQSGSRPHHMWGLMKQFSAGIENQRIRGVPVDVVTSRIGQLSGKPSPYVNSGFHFGANYDVTLFPYDSTRTRRINMVSIHLLSRGLSEMGGSLNGSHDQTYATVGEFRQIQQDAQTASSESEWREENRQIVAERLVAAARAGLEWEPYSS